MSFLQPAEVDALLAAPDRHRWEGRRDHALIALAVQTGLRVSELTGLTCGDIQLDAHAHVRCQGKGRKQRCVPLTASNVAILRVWIERNVVVTATIPSSRPAPGGTSAQTPWKPASAVHKTSATERCPSLRHKKLTPHTLRHTCAMTLLHEGVESRSSPYGSGHADIRSTDAYMHADMTIKETSPRAHDPGHVQPGRYQPARPPAGLPGKPVIIPISNAATGSEARPDQATAQRTPPVGIVPESA